ncbi:MAG: c-type cytochrome [Acidobacteria bacterium]|nr:c-type cytochrome [Acidobacteriota bacterium]
MPDTPINNPDDPKDLVEATEPMEDPIVSRSLSVPILVSSLLLVLSLFWALYEEALGHRPWRTYQKQFIEVYAKHLEKMQPVQKKDEDQIRKSPEYQRLEQGVKAAEAAAAPRLAALDGDLAAINRELEALTEPFQLARSEVSALTYRTETAESENSKQGLGKELEELKKGPFEVRMPVGDGAAGATAQVSFTYGEIENKFNELKGRQGRLLSQKGDALKPVAAARKERDDYLLKQIEGLTPEQLTGLRRRLDEFQSEIKQIDVPGVGLVERCESCHLGVREPLTLTKADMGGHAEFVSHPNRELLQIHDPERFGCTPCHGGNGIATTGIETAHGQYKHWLWPKYDRENVEAGCQQCHQRDIVLDHSSVLDKGKQTFLDRGCWGCHARENFDPEPAQIQLVQKTTQQLQEKKEANVREAARVERQADRAPDNATAQKLYQQAENLRVSGSTIDSQVEQLNLQLKSLIQQQKKVGPTLKEMQNKLRKEWVPVWIQNPHNFRPTTRMPRFRLDRGEVEAISAFLWQSAYPNQKLPVQPPGDPGRGKQAFETRGCLACHSIGEGSERIGGTFAANLSRVGEKVNYDYLVRWVHNPRERTLPYCPKEKRDITPEDYARHNQPFLFDQDHSQCPNDGAEMIVQQMTVMPSLRLTWEEARDIASYLVQQTKPASYPPAPFIDDPSLKERGRALVRNYGCAGCHEITGLEEEQRIGTELTLEGSKPIERLDFALLTEPAKRQGWYNPKGFFEHKLSDPAIYDKGKIKSKTERLKMPRFDLNKEEVTAVATFLLGSVASTVPRQYFYNPEDQRRDVQEGWWIIQKYNCMGCHTLRPGQKSVLSELPQYAEARELLPPSLLGEGARVDPGWLLRFMKDPSLSEAAGAPSRPGAPESAAASSAMERQRDRNGIRSYLKVRMPTFYFSQEELRKLVRFFEGLSRQPEPYIKQPQEPLTEPERVMARQLFNSTAAPCLKCHATGDPQHDQTANAPNFLFVKERLKPGWTERWLVNPQIISPGTAMPSGLFRRDGNRWVFAGPVPDSFKEYQKDHTQLLVRYMFQLTPEEQARSR